MYGSHNMLEWLLLKALSFSRRGENVWTDGKLFLTGERGEVSFQNRVGRDVGVGTKHLIQFAGVNGCGSYL